MDNNKLRNMDQFEGKIQPIDLAADAQKLATFFNEIDDLWPGTFTQGIKFDEKRAREFIGKRKALETYVAFDPTDRIVGFVSVHKRMEELNVSYIGILGAHPDVLSKKYGKHLLLTAIEFSVANGDIRQDLHTWASNMKAVPLYKKIGLQWVPDTSVYMQNYVPAILQDSFCKPYFEKHPDWYLDQKRDFSQAPDDNSFGKMKVFNYHFENNGDYLKVMVDRYSRSIMGITRCLDGEELSLILQYDEHDVFTGIIEPFSLKVENKTSKEFSLNVAFEPSNEITPQKTQLSTHVPIGSVSIDNSYSVIDTTIDSSIYRKTPSIKARITLNGNDLILESGVRAKQPVDITGSDLHRWIPTGKQHFGLNINNRTTNSIQGDIVFWSDSDIHIHNPVNRINIEPESYIGLQAVLEIPEFEEDKAITLFCQLRMKEAKSRVFEVPVFVSDHPAIAARIQADKKRVFLQNQYVQSIIHLEGARATLKSTEDSAMGLSVNILDFGPPFGFSEFNQVKFDPEIIYTKNSIRVKLTKRSRSKENLVFSRYIELRPGDTHIAVWEEIQNLGLIQDQVTILMQPSYSGGINLPMGNRYLIFENELVTGPNYLWPIREGDLPEGTDRYEPWVCVESGNVTYYHIYQTENTLANPSRGSLTTLEKTVLIPSLSTASSPKSWLGCSLKDTWKGVRDLSYYLCKKTLLSHSEKWLNPKSYLEFSIPNDDLLLGNKINTVNLSLTSTRFLPLSGQVVFDLPDGWICSPESQEFSELNLKNPQSFSFQIQLPEITKSHTDKFLVRIKSPTGEISKEFPVLVFNGSLRPKITTLAPIDEKSIIKVQNESLEITSSKDFVGTLTSLRYMDTDYVLSNFPTMVPSLFFNQDPAGLLTILLGQNDDLSDLKFFKEQYHELEVHNDPWYGVEYTVNVTERKSLKGLVFKTSYELLGGDSNLLKVSLSVSNPTSATFQLLSLSLLSPAINGTIDNLTSHINVDDSSLRHTFTRENPQPIFALGSKSLTRLDYVKDGKMLSIVAPQSDTNLFPLDAGKMILGGGVAKSWNLEPNKSESCSFFLVLGSPDDMNSEEISNLFRQ
ncbi:MAG: GNAT family N-acetyltransferase [Candidatus Hodarchaeales archaeon]